MFRPSSGAHASTVQRPSTARVGRSSGSHRVCLTPVRFSPFTKRRMRPNCFSGQESENHVRLARHAIRILFKALSAGVVPLDADATHVLCFPHAHEAGAVPRCQRHILLNARRRSRAPARRCSWR